MKIQDMNFEQYNEKFVDYLEYIGMEYYVDVIHAETHEVAMSLAHQAQSGYMLGISYRKCAILSWAALVKAIVELNKKERVM